MKLTGSGKTWSGCFHGEISSLKIWHTVQKNVFIKLYEAPPGPPENIPAHVKVFSILSTKSQTLFAAVSAESVPDLPYREAVLPAKGLSSVKNEIESLEKRINSIEKELALLAGEKPMLASYIEDLDNRIGFEQVRSGMNVDGKLSYLTGYVPGESVSALKEAASKTAGTSVRDPDPEDPVPTLVKNRSSVKIIHPVFSMLGTVPGYRERDISSLFLIFFTVFFAMIIGDAGYGLVFLLTSVYFSSRKKKSEGKVPDTLRLLLVLSSFTVFWGAITGNYFGSEAVSRIPPFSWLVIPPLYNFSPASSANVQFICFILGVVQLSIAHIWNFLREVKQKPVLRSFARLYSFNGADCTFVPCC